MSKPGVVQQVIAYLEGRNRWLDAGNNNLLAYLSVMLGHGPQVDVLNELFRDPPEEIHVVRDAVRVVRVGLSAWVDQADIEADEVPEQLADAWQMIARLQTALAVTEAQSRARGADLEAMLELAAEVDASSQEAALAVVVEPPVECKDCIAFTQEVKTMNRRIVALQSVIKQRREAATQVAERHKVEIEQLRHRVRELEPDAAGYRELKTDPLALFNFVEDVLGARVLTTHVHSFI